jgi:hypothetical protein
MGEDVRPKARWSDAQTEDRVAEMGKLRSATGHQVRFLRDIRTAKRGDTGTLVRSMWGPEVELPNDAFFVQFGNEAFMVERRDLKLAYPSGVGVNTISATVQIGPRPLPRRRLPWLVTEVRRLRAEVRELQARGGKRG